MSRFWNALAIAAACSSILGLLIVLKSWSMGSLEGLSGAVILPTASALDREAGREAGREADGKVSSESAALQNYQQAAELAKRALKSFESASNTDNSALKLDLMIQERSLWQKALKKLELLSPSSPLYARSLAKKTQYERRLAMVEGKLVKANDEGFILAIIQDANVDPQAVHVTLCQVDSPHLVDRLATDSAAPSASTPSENLSRAQGEAEASTATTTSRQSQSFVQRSFQRQEQAPIPTTKVVIASSERSPFPLVKGQLNRDRCRHHQGEQLMASPASLIKIPIAVALASRTAITAAEAEMTATEVANTQFINSEVANSEVANLETAATDSSIDLDQKIYIDPGNFTENAEGAVIEIGQDYSLREVMSRMITHSDNIATNQLIDYLGYSNIEQALKQLGYSQTLVGHKLAGNQVIPQDFGISSNQSSTHEITAMMAQIYAIDTPANRDIIAALHQQADRELGYEALTGESPAELKIEWLGEKTGQNDEVLASTLAMSIGEDYYVLTVALDNDSDLYGLRQIIRGLADHLSKVGPLLP